MAEQGSHSLIAISALNGLQLPQSAVKLTNDPCLVGPEPVALYFLNEAGDLMFTENLLSFSAPDVLKTLCEQCFGHSQMTSSKFLGFLTPPCQDQTHSTYLALVRIWITPHPPLC